MSLFTAPTCRSCLARLAAAAAAGPTQQIRTKSTKLNKSSGSLMVRLLIDIPKVGRKGAIVSVARGMMRNFLYPRAKAEYITAAALKHIPPEEYNPVPDISFPPDLEEGSTPAVSLNLLKPAHTVSLLESFLPESILFTRPTITPTEPTIHGSISTADICSAVRAIANASGEEASRVAVNPDMISFLGNFESDKVKTLGEHPFEIRFKGAVKPVVRKVVITQQISLE
ncbi:hypothetical protein FN846DRAFT_677444 [Sphaerosporella brunnea]|uniref:Ribosomal protein L9 domain-containing protein n=1 Tax=Sphaerosporella brunnea TaxID=1250544 RepID=A0A5J5FAK2_9PEZI|nr:hypothetical protein FN846DRAFT_677444 [Sphaerosporella brunnea]